MAEWITATEYGKRVGAEAETIRYAMKNGRIAYELRMNKRMIDWDEEKDSYKNNTNPEQQNYRNSTETTGVAGKKNIPSYADSRAIREAYSASIAKLDYEKKLGKMVELEKIKDINFSLARRVREGVLQVPQMLAPELASMTDTFEIEQRMVSALCDAITNATK